ncbi:DUF2141 domain-containing protein [uncultured Dokdonia sp.]|uniref:DUF2141 domain-containing protein n=1 Tax=uncultured Dokdonia sp. TaxID=575653 RepID=UPI002604A45B|nr:DUF2141 domain-containing protein [uncultured Dokdonia sp.]
MKTFIYLTALLFSTFAFAQDTKGITVTIEIENLLNNDGKVSAALYDEATFMRAAPLDATEAVPENKMITLTFKNVQPGTYGIITLHDFNENGRMDFEPSGMPKEPYGLSGAGVGFGPPSWGDAKFTVGEEDITLKITM